MLYLVTYPCRNSLTGEGVSIVREQDIVEFGNRHTILTCHEYVREECKVFTPAVVAACMGDSPSL